MLNLKRSLGVAAHFALASVLLAQAQPTAAGGGPTPTNPGAISSGSARATPPIGYYRQPAISADSIVFVAEGDLWRVPLAGGAATRLTSHPGEETQPQISADGKMVAFLGEYEGARDVYVMPVTGGTPKRLTFDGSSRGGTVAGWTADGKVLAVTDRQSTLPCAQLITIDPATGQRAVIELAQASDGTVDPVTGTVFFVKLPFQGSSTKRYKGGFIQQLWSYSPGEAVAKNLTADFDGTSRRPMLHGGRVYFMSDRDGHMNVWSMSPSGQDLRQHTRHVGFDALGGSVWSDKDGKGRIAYQLGADIWVLDLTSGTAAPLTITLPSDLDQLRERWTEKPWQYVTSWHLSPSGDRAVITARGKVFVAPHKQGRLVDVMRDDSARYRAARFLPDGKSLVAMSDKSGEVEIYTLPANGVGSAAQLTSDGQVLRWDGIPSPDGKLIAHHDKNQRLFVLDLATKSSVLVDEQPYDDFAELAWSPDSKWLAYVNQAANFMSVIKLYSVESKVSTAATTDRFLSTSPAWSPDGKYLYFLSDRTVRSITQSPWGPYNPKPHLTEMTRPYALALRPLQAGERFPFAPKDELAAAKDPKKDEKKPEPAKKDEPSKKDEPNKKDDPAGAAAKKEEGGKVDNDAKAATDGKDKDGKEGKDKDAKEVKPVEIQLDGLPMRLYEVPVPAGNYTSLVATEKSLFWLSAPTAFTPKNDLKAVEIKGENIEVKTVASDVEGFELSVDGKKLGIRKGESLAIVDAAAAPAELDKNLVNLAGWTFPVDPKAQWPQMYADAWRLMRDYFYDTQMHGVDWKAMKTKYRPLVDRVTTRAELNDVLAQMVGELSALHIFVRGGDLRAGPERISLGMLGAVTVRDEQAGGHRVVRIYRNDPDEPARAGPLSKPEVGVKVGDVIETIDGTATLGTLDLGELLRTKAGKQVLIRFRPANIQGGKPDGTFVESRDAVVVPITAEQEADLRYHQWELERRELVEKASDNKFGYVHLRAMGTENYAEWAKGYFPAFDRQGLIIDVRHNRGGNIDSWILTELLRRAWFSWAPRVGKPYWNMQFAFRGHVVVLCNENTASDGEAFAEGFRALGLGKVIGSRTWGGEIWLSSSNVLLDKGIASAAEIGVFGPDGTWLIEGRGVEPDIRVDNNPRTAFLGEDTQLNAAIDHLKKLCAEKPIAPVAIPSRPNKSSPDNKGAK